MGKSVDVVLKKTSPNQGIIYIRTIVDGVQRRKSINEKISVRDWEIYFNKKTKRFRIDRRFERYEIINEKIDSYFNKLPLFKNDLGNISNQHKSFLKYWLDNINLEKNEGTRIKHLVIYRKFQKFLKSRERFDVAFSEIDQMFLKQLKNYLEKSKDPKSLSTNSVNHYLKVIKLVINKAKKDDYYHYTTDPFSSIVFKSDKVTKPALKEDEIKKLIDSKIEDKSIQLVRDIFLFQLFANGARISDTLLLKVGNIKDLRINYVMYKTKTQTYVPINRLLAQILCRILSFGDIYSSICQNYKSDIPLKYLKEVYRIRKAYSASAFHPPTQLTVNIIELDKLINYLIQQEKKGFIKPLTGNTHDDIIILRQNSEENMERITNPYVNYKGYEIQKTNEDLKKLIDIKSHTSSIIDDIFLKQFQDFIISLPQEKFVFEVLNPSLFTDWKWNKSSNLNEQQYKELKHQTIVYNRKLKKLQQLTNIKTNLTSHVARHTFAGLLLDFKVNLYDISLSLGHTTLKTTENYLRSGFDSNRIDYLSDKMDDTFSF
jgi:site-specific recombinase XerD